MSVVPTTRNSSWCTWPSEHNRPDDVRHAAAVDDDSSPGNAARTASTVAGKASILRSVFLTLQALLNGANNLHSRLATKALDKNKKNAPNKMLGFINLFEAPGSKSLVLAALGGRNGFSALLKLLSSRATLQ